MIRVRMKMRMRMGMGMRIMMMMMMMMMMMIMLMIMMMIPIIAEKNLVHLLLPHVLHRVLKQAHPPWPRDPSRWATVISPSLEICRISMNVDIVPLIFMAGKPSPNLLGKTM